VRAIAEITISATEPATYRPIRYPFSNQPIVSAAEVELLLGWVAVGEPSTQAAETGRPPQSTSAGFDEPLSWSELFRRTHSMLAITIS
jgi:hypothetical protein